MWVDQVLPTIFEVCFRKKTQDFLQKIQGTHIYYVYIIVYSSTPLPQFL